MQSHSVSLTNVGDLGIRIGDYLMIDDEIVRVKDRLQTLQLTHSQYFVQSLEREQQLM